MYIGNRTIAGLLDGLLSGASDSSKLYPGAVGIDFCLRHKFIKVLLELETELGIPTQGAMSRLNQFRDLEPGPHPSITFLPLYEVISILRELGLNNYEHMEFVGFMEAAGFPDPDFEEFDIEQYTIRYRHYRRADRQATRIIGSFN